MIIDSFFDANTLLFIAKISLATLLGLLLGLERVAAGKAAGMRIYALVSLASALFVITAETFVLSYPVSVSSPDSIIRMAAQIVVGVGFLGTGLIIFKDGHIENLTTATALWVCAGIGMATGLGMFKQAIIVTILTFFVLSTLSTFESKIRTNISRGIAIPLKEKSPRTRKKKEAAKPLTE